MTPQELKNSILQLAIQGKLVEQRPEEGTAEELYLQIQEEKKRLIAEGKIKKEKPLPEIVEEEKPFDIPESWKWVRLNSIISLLSGSDLTPDKYNDQKKGIPYITGASNIEKDKIVFNRWTEYPNNIAHKGDVLLTCKGTVGKTTILEENDVHIARQIMSITTILIEKVFLQFFIDSQVENLKSKAKSMIPGIERDNVLRLLFPLPPLAEQKRIVAKIEELLPLIDRYEAAWNRLESFNKRFPDDMQKSILQLAIQGKLVEQRPEEGSGEELYQQIQEEKKRLIAEGKIKKEKPLPEITDDEIPFDIPENWKWVRIGNISKKISSGNTPPGGRNSNVYVSTGYPFFREQNIYDDGIHSEGLVFISEELLNHRENSTVLAKDILLNITGGSIGRCSLVPDDFDRGSINQHILIIRMVEPELRYYVHYLICSPFIQNYIKGNAVGDKDGFSGGRCKNMLIPLPPLAEQKRIVAKLEELLPLCDGLKES